MAQPTFDDVVMYQVDFENPQPIHGWVIIRKAVVCFTDADDDRALRHARELASASGARCFFRVNAGGVIEEIKIQ